jgi:hypothetical protein
MLWFIVAIVVVILALVAWRLSGREDKIPHSAGVSDRDARIERPAKDTNPWSGITGQGGM